jgi:hypothetical protein
MFNRPTKEKALINAGGELMSLYSTLNLLKQDRDNKKNELDKINAKIKTTVAAIKKKGGKASIT